MQTHRFARLAAFSLLALFLTACAGASSPWSAHDATADLKARASDPGAVCPVVFSNATDMMIEAGYLALGIESSVGLIPSGHSLEISVSCTQERIEAFAVAERGMLDDVVRYRKLARLNLAQVTHLDITAADRVW
ncbi:MAG: hypothetical protein WD995_07090 [Gemmatimonadota bacterium]